MIKYFPLPYPDELIYSTIARFIKHLGTKNIFEILSTIFGKNRSVIMDLPFGIQGLLNNTFLNKFFTAEEIVLKHTLFPYYAAFVGKEKRAN